MLSTTMPFSVVLVCALGLAQDLQKSQESELRVAWQKLLQTKGRDLQKRALYAIKARFPAAKLIPFLISNLSVKDHESQRRAARALNEIGAPARSSLIASLEGMRNNRGLKLAFWVLRKSNPAQIETLVRLVADGKRNANLALVRLGSRAEAQLLHALRKPGPGSRNLLMSLIDIDKGSEAGIEVLLRYLVAPNGITALLATRALEQVGRPALKQLIELAKGTKDHRLARRVKRVLRSINPDGDLWLQVSVRIDKIMKVRVPVQPAPMVKWRIFPGGGPGAKVTTFRFRF